MAMTATKKMILEGMKTLSKASQMELLNYVMFVKERHEREKAKSVSRTKRTKANSRLRKVSRFRAGFQRKGEVRV